MTTHSINVPDAWQIHTANGRYEETMFEFQFENSASTTLSVRLVGQSSTEHDAIYTITVVMNDGKERSLLRSTLLMAHPPAILHRDYRTQIPRERRPDRMS